MATIDENTGLAKLPKGYFWRVKTEKHAFYSIYPWVELRQYRGKRQMRSRLIGALYSSSDRFATVEDKILYLTTELAKSFYNDQYIEVTKASLEGEYPPKKLEA